MNSEYTLGISLGQGRISAHIPHLMGFLSQHFVNLNRPQFKAFLKHALDQEILKSLELTLHDTDLRSEAPNHDQRQDEPALFQNRQTVMRNEQGLLQNLPTIKRIVFYLSVQDREILNVYQQLHSVLKPSKDYEVFYVHFSGALYDPNIIGIHPLMTFVPDVKYSQSLYPDIPLKCDHPSWVEQHPHRLGYIAPEDKPLYHALCVMLGNFPQLLINLVSQNMPEQFKLQDFGLLINYSIKNVLEVGASGLTGPHIRKDVETITKHLKTLEGTELGKVYAQLSEIFSKEVAHA